MRVRTRLMDHIITYLIETPKHFIAIATSNQTAALGNVICEMAKKDARLGGALVAQRDRKYRPKAAINPENTHVRIPGMIPPDAMAYYGSSKLTLGL
jgi:hypothetical protein